MRLLRSLARTGRVAAAAALAGLAACGESSTGPGGDLTVDPMRALAVGERHACALTTHGEAYCWGENGSGQLGNGSLTNSATPVKVAGGRRFIAVTAGGSHTCALTGGGNAYCWGANLYGQLGTGRQGAEWEPTPVAGGHEFTTLSAGGLQHSCGTTAGGRLLCWGGDRDAQLGFATTETCVLGAGSVGCSRAPREVTLGGVMAGVSAGFLHTCAIRSGGAATCWGENSAGQLGTGASGARVPPAPVSGTLRFQSISSGATHVCGIDALGRAHCWGDSAMGALGTPQSSFVPVEVRGALAFRQISVSHGNTILGHSCGVAADGRAYCWGADDAGQLGSGGAATQRCDARVGSVPCSDTPRTVSGTERWSVVVAGSRFTCGIAVTRAAYCWGTNGAGQLGTGGTSSAATPQMVSGAVRFEAITVGG